jgi:lysophospholipase
MAEAAARLVDTPEAPVPPGGLAETFVGEGGAPLRAALWRPSREPRGSVILSPGRTEPIEKYFEVVGELLERGFVVLAHDWRGQGLSHRLLPDRMRGYAQDWRHFVADHRALLAAFEARLPHPRIALAHSMGCCLVALALPDEPRLDAALFTGPMFGVHLGALPLWLSRGLARVVCRAGGRAAYVPRGGVYDPRTADFDPGNILTHDQTRWERHRAQLQACPELALGGVTWGWLHTAFEAMEQAKRPSTGRAIAIPMVLLVGGEERLVVNADTRAFAANLPRAKVVEVPGSRHEIMMETDAVRAVFWREFDALAASL